MTANERHFKRDAILSQKHRTWGYNVPAMDVDFLLCEFDNLVPVALIDYRHINGTVNTQSVGAKVMRQLGNMAGLPAFIVQYRYASDDGTAWKEATLADDAFFWIIPLNDHAEQLFYSWGDDDWLNEPQYKDWLHQIRGRKP